MDATRQRFAYSCLPLNIANGYGWDRTRLRVKQFVPR
jgi:hypothetical protein